MGAAACAAGLGAFEPIAWLPMLVCHGVDLWTLGILFVDHRVGEAIEVVDAEPELAVLAPRLIFGKQVSHPFELGKEGLGHRDVRVLGVVDGSVAQLGLSLGVNPVGHAKRARTLASASSPGTIRARPERTSSRRRWASCIQAACAGDLGSKLAIRRSKRRARSSGGRLNACASRSSTGRDMIDLSLLAPHSMHQPRCRGDGDRQGGRLRGALRCRALECIFMDARVDHLLDEVLGLSTEERSAVAAALIDSLEGTEDGSVSDAWRQELLRRREALRTGATKALPWAQARARLSAL